MRKIIEKHFFGNLENIFKKVHVYVYVYVYQMNCFSCELRCYTMPKA